MSLFKRGNVWWSFFYIDGYRHQHSTGTSNRRLAEQIEQKIREEAEARRFAIARVDPDLTVADLAARFIANARATAFHHRKLKQLLPYFGDVAVVRVSRSMAREYRQWRHKSKRLTEATINRELAVLRRIFFWAADEELISHNPMERLHLERERRVKRTVISVTDEDHLIEVAPEHLRRMIVTCRFTGMRRGEILAQLWEHIDLNRRVLYVTRSKTAGGEFRELPLAQQLYDLLLVSQQLSGPVFTYHDRALGDFTKAWLKTSHNVLGHRMRFHDLRHAFNTRLMEAGVIPDVRRALMGHSTGRDTNAIYTHVELHVKREAIAKLEQWLEAQRQREKQLVTEQETHAALEQMRPVTRTLQ